MKYEKLINLILIILFAVIVTGCQTKIDHDELEPGYYLDAGRVLSVEVNTVDFGEPTSIVTTHLGTFTIKGIPSVKKYEKSQMQGDYLYLKNKEGVIKRYEIW